MKWLNLVNMRNMGAYQQSLNKFLSFFAPNKVDTGVAAGVGLNTYTCSTVRYVQDFEGLLKQVPINKSASPGLRQTFYVEEGAVAGADLVINGSFTTDTDWFKSPGWTIDTGAKVAVANTTAWQNIYQTTSVTAGKRYRVTFTLKTITSGSVLYLVGGVQGPEKTLVGTHVEEITATATTYHSLAAGASGFVGTVDDFKVEEIQPAWADFTSLNISCWGDSLTQDYTGAGIAYPNLLHNRYGCIVDNQGVSGNTSTQILARFNANYQLWDNITVIYSGNNNIAAEATVLSDIASMVSTLGTNTKYIVLTLPTPSDATTGSANYNHIIAINNSIISTYPDNHIDMRAYLMSQGTTAQDTIDVANGVIPSSLRVDNIHPNAMGHQLVANKIAEFISTKGWNVGQRTQLVSKGVLSEPAGVNLISNSIAPATQSITVTAVPHTLSIMGIGTATLTGVATGNITGTSATDVKSLTVVPAAGSLTVTLSGGHAITALQVEASSANTSFMLGSGATTSRTATNSAYVSTGNISGTVGTFITTFTPLTSALNQALICVNGDARLMAYFSFTLNTLTAEDGTATRTLFTGIGGSVGTPIKVAMAWNGTNIRTSVNGAAVQTTAWDGDWNLGASFYLGSGATAYTCHGYFGATKIFNTALSNTELQRAST